MQRKKILLIDDEVDRCLLQKAYFLRKNYEVFMSPDIDSALERAVAVQPHIIMLDTGLCNDPDAYMKKLRELVHGVEIYSSHNED